ncbi:siderophore-interacting protein [Rhodococcus sp. G-MC3]|uniref:siderophore-interacting protein n=1 Tax=Rhodococcus sp. G-MC3 TaxID=3046209 RepID=UPI0024B9FCA1|nr:siderophore-interacting protein [Rhodococcus sp. G-MC3]MDJ0395399.1 siderophore-interacting protein [Rhodococcus sp. G-MC3]
MEVPDPLVGSTAPSMLALAITRPRPGVLRVTSMLDVSGDRSEWDAATIADWLQFPGVSPFDFRVRRFDAERGIVDIDFVLATRNVMLQAWLETIEVGSRTRIAEPGTGHLPNFASGRRVLMFADESAVVAVHAILEKWPASAHGMVWIDTPSAAAVAELPVVDGVGVFSFHVDMGFDPLVTVARRIDLNQTTTVWAAGERTRMDSIRATCHAAGLGEDDTRVFGYWSDEVVRQRG